MLTRWQVVSLKSPNVEVFAIRRYLSLFLAPLLSCLVLHQSRHPFPFNSHHAAPILLEQVISQLPGRTGLRAIQNTTSLRSLTVGGARRWHGQRPVCIILIATLSLTEAALSRRPTGWHVSRRPTGWHGESGAAHYNYEHLTVDFHLLRGKHVVMHHVYSTDLAY